MLAPIKVTFLMLVCGMCANSLKHSLNRIHSVHFPKMPFVQKVAIAIVASALHTPALTFPVQAVDFPTSMQLNKQSTEEEFIVVKASDAEKNRLQVDSWSTWSSGDVKFKNKIYSVKEVCYIDSGKFQITPEGGTPITVQAGDFVTFPKGFKCTWDISEPVFKHWKEY